VQQHELIEGWDRQRPARQQLRVMFWTLDRAYERLKA
jgi:hypothetical protein